LYSTANPGDGFWYSLGDVDITPPSGEVWTGKSCVFKRSHTDDVSGTTGNNSGVEFNGNTRVGDSVRNESLVERITGGEAIFSADENNPLNVSFEYQGCDESGSENLGLEDDFELIITFDRNMVDRQEEQING